jgi:Tfp pilus assembly protein PilN
VAVAAGGAAEAPPISTLQAPDYPWVRELAQQVRYALQSLSYERGLNIGRLYVCGKGATERGADWRLSEGLDLPVTLLAPVEKPDAAQYATAYGCAVQAAGGAAVALNLTPARVAVAREIEQRRQTRFSWSVLAGAVTLAAALVLGAMFYHRQQVLAETQRRLDELRVNVPAPPMKPEELKASAEAVGEALNARVTAGRAISALSRHLPEGTWLAELTYNAQTGSVVRGYSTDRNGPQRALVALLRQRTFDEVTLDYQTQDQVGGVPVWGFQLTCKLRPPEQTGARRGVRR